MLHPTLETHSFRRYRSAAIGTLLLAGLTLRAGYVRAAEEAPPWLKQAAAIKVPQYDKKVHAVVLQDEARITVDDEGRMTTTRTQAIRILAREGRSAAIAREVYIAETGKVREMRAWLIRASGEVKKYGKDKVIELAAAENDVYNEVRVKLIDAGEDADAGSVFGCEVVSEDRSVFFQFDWDFQRRLPTLLSRFSVALPAGWRAESVIFNHERLDPIVSGSGYTWELRDLPFIEEEPASPNVTSLAPRLAVSVFPAAGKRVSGKSFADWKAVSRWLSELSDPQGAPNDAMAAKVQSLMGGAGSEFEKIRAVAQFAQSVNYVSIQTGVGRGGGYRPHAASEVFAKSYGDCKDKANLMRAMLKAAGIPSYLLSIYSGDPTYVREEWPSPQQFNHCIIAVGVSDETQGATTIRHPTLGRLLVFDPTDSQTPLGDLPDHEQGSLGLVVAGDAGALLRMPVVPPEGNRMEHRIEATLDAEGRLTASVRENSVGQSAVGERRMLRYRSQAEYTKLIERWITLGATGAKVTKVNPADHNTEGRFELEVNFTAPNYAQLMQGRLLVFKPAVVTRRGGLLLSEPSRKHPIVLEAESFVETARIALPGSFAVDEIPDSVKIEKPFGTYTTQYEVKEGALLFNRALTIRAGTLPAGEYAAVRGFFEQINATDQAPVVLVKK
jgi:hypothetical protein